MTVRRKSAIGLVATVLSTLLLSLLVAGSARAAALSITYSPGTVSDGATISVSGNAGGPNAPDLYVAVCEDTPTASNCDQSLAGIGGSQAHILVVSPNPTTGAWGPVNFYVRQVIVTGHTPGGFDCKAHGTCVIGTTNSVNPTDHTYNVTKTLDFGSTPEPPAPPTPSVTVTPSAAPTTPTATPTGSSTPTATSSSSAPSGSSTPGPTGPTSSTPTATSTGGPQPTSTTPAPPTSSPPAEGGLSISYTPSKVADGMTISVRGNAGRAGAPTLFVAVCEGTPTATNCDQSLQGVGGPKAHILQVTPDATTGAWGPVSFYVRQVIVTGNTPGGFDCKAHGTCVIGSTNAMNPKDHTYNVTAPLNFSTAAVPVLPPSVPTSDGPLTTGSPAVTAGGTVTVAGDGFAPDSVVALGIYSSPTDLGTTAADASGAISATVRIPTSLVGSHTLVAIGTDAAGAPRALTQAITVSASTSGGGGNDGGSGNGTGGQGGAGGSGTRTLAATGSGAEAMTPLVAGAGVAVVLFGLILLLGATRPAPRRH